MHETKLYVRRKNPIDLEEVEGDQLVEKKKKNLPDYRTTRKIPGRNQ